VIIVWSEEFHIRMASMLLRIFEGATNGGRKPNVELRRTIQAVIIKCLKEGVLV
jgi:hypothetical protein